MIKLQGLNQHLNQQGWKVLLKWQQREELLPLIIMTTTILKVIGTEPELLTENDEDDYGTIIAVEV